MKVKKYNLFGISASWPFWLVDTIMTALIGYAVYYNYFVIGTALGWGLPIFLLVLAATYGITAVFYYCRYRFQKSIAGQTYNGTFVIVDKKVWSNPAMPLFNINLIAQQIQEVKQFWYNWYETDGVSYRLSLTKPGVPEMLPQRALDSLDEAFNGAFLVIVDDPIVQQSSLGPMAYKVPKAMGLQDGQTMAVVWSQKINPGIDNLLNIIKHEAGHLALTALKIPNDDKDIEHHKIFAQANYGA
jgi:hypothetical protein